MFFRLAYGVAESTSENYFASLGDKINRGREIVSLNVLAQKGGNVSL